MAEPRVPDQRTFYRPASLPAAGLSGPARVSGPSSLGEPRRPLLWHARHVSRFILSECCTNCQRAISVEELDELVVAALSTRPPAEPEPPAPESRPERAVSTLAAAVLLVVGILVGFFWRRLIGAL